MEALQRVRRVGVPDTLDRLLAIIEEMIFAESIQLEHRGRIDTSRESYFRVVEGKTAALFRWATFAGAKAGGLDAAILFSDILVVAEAHRWEGLLTPRMVRSAVEFCADLVDSGRYPWAAVTSWGFPEDPTRAPGASDCGELTFAVRVDRPGSLLRDYHTSGGGTFRGDSSYSVFGIKKGQAVATAACSSTGVSSDITGPESCPRASSSRSTNSITAIGAASP